MTTSPLPPTFSLCGLVPLCEPSFALTSAPTPSEDNSKSLELAPPPAYDFAHSPIQPGSQKFARHAPPLLPSRLFPLPLSGRALIRCSLRPAFRTRQAAPRPGPRFGAIAMASDFRLKEQLP